MPPLPLVGRRAARRSAARSRVWTVFVVFMLLASVVPAFSNPALAQEGDPPPAEEPQVMDPVEEEPPVEEPPMEEPPGEEPPMEEPPAEEPPMEEPDEMPPSDQPGDGQPMPPVQRQLDVPAMQMQPGSISATMRLCPPGYDLAAADPGMLEQNCGEYVPLSFRIYSTMDNTYVDSEVDSGGAGRAYWENLPPQLYVVIPIYEIADAKVFCVGDISNTRPYAQVLTDDMMGAPLDLMEGENVSCNWYAMPMQEGFTVVIHKYACPEEYEGSMTDVDMMMAGCRENAGQVTFSLAEMGGMGYMSDPKQTAGAPGQMLNGLPNSVEWEGVPDVPLWIYEQVPAGYGSPEVYCKTQSMDGQELSGYSPYRWDGSRIEVKSPGAGYVLFCAWFNIPGYGDIAIAKYVCPEGYDASSRSHEQLAMDCAERKGDVSFTVTSGMYEETDSTSEMSPYAAEFMKVPAGDVMIEEMVPDGYATLKVFCKAERPMNGSDPAMYNDIPVKDGNQITVPLQDGYTISCDWFNVSMPQYSTVMVRSWECPEGMMIDRTYDAYRDACTQPKNDHQFTLIDGNGPRPMATMGGQVEWADVATGPLSLSGMMGDGYYPNPYVACSWTTMPGGQPIARTTIPGRASTMAAMQPMDGTPQPIETINGVINTAIMAPNTMVACDWFSQYAGPGEVTIYKWTCPEGYDPYAWNANPKMDCTEATNGITFVLDQPMDIDLQSRTGDSIPGAVYFGGLMPGTYIVHEMVPDGTAGVFVLDCVGLNTGSVHPVPLSVGPSLEMRIAGGDSIACDWYNLPAYDPAYGWMTITKYACGTATYVSEIDCEVYERGQRLTLQTWNGANWIDAGAGTTNKAGQLTFTNLAPGTYRLTELGKTACLIKSDRISADGYLAVQAQMGTTVKVYNCGEAPQPGGKMPTKYPVTGVEPVGSSRENPAGALFGALGLLGTASLSRRALLRRSVAATAVLGGGSLAVTAALARQPIVPLDAEGTPAATPGATPGIDCLYPATPEATPEGVLPGTPVACARGVVPKRVRIETIEVDAAIEILEIIGGEMEQPTGAEDIAWYKESARLGERGNILLAGHLNFWGVPEGVFFRLAQLREGDRIEIEGEDGQTYRYVVQWSDDFPTDEEPPEEALGQDMDEEAVTLITCGGEWNVGRAEYDHRTLVRAVRELEEPEGTPAS